MEETNVNDLSKSFFSIDSKQFEEVGDFDVNDVILCDCKFRVKSKRVITSNPTTNESGETITEAKEPVISCDLELVAIEVTNKKEERKRADEMGISVKKYRELKLKHNKM